MPGAVFDGFALVAERLLPGARRRALSVCVRSPTGFVKACDCPVLGIAIVALTVDLGASEPWRETLVRPFDQRRLSHHRFSSYLVIKRPPIGWFDTGAAAQIVA